MPFVSVVMPSYRSARFVRNSVDAVLGQTFGDLELIVVNDASPDEAGSILRELAAKDARIRLFDHHRNLGAAHSRNDGLRLARGQFIGFCDSDDIWKPDKLRSQIDLLQANPGYDITYCDAEIIDEAGVGTSQLFSDMFPLPKTRSGGLFAELCSTNFINMQTVLMRRGPIGDRIFFDEGIRLVEDWWQWIRLSRHHRFLYDPHPLARYRVHGASSNLNRAGVCANRWKVCKRNLRAHPDMTRSLRALIWYHMGVELSLLGRHRTAARFLQHAGRLSLAGGMSPRRLLALGGRTAIESLRGMGSG